jgi:SP family general alpha glucoside:H+ symporter-like MFS transporter
MVNTISSKSRRRRPRNVSDKVSAASQSVLKQITKAGQLVGLAATGWIVDRIGYKWTMLGALVGIVPIVFMQFFAPNKEVLIAAQFLIGIPLAPFLTLSNVSYEVLGFDQMADCQVYASEVSPLALQPYMTSATSLAWSVGGFISVAVLRGVINVENWGLVMSLCHHS